MKKAAGAIAGKRKKRSVPEGSRIPDASCAQEFSILSDIALLSGFSHDCEKKVFSIIQEAGLRTGLSRIMVFSRSGTGRYVACCEWCTENIDSHAVGLAELDLANLPTLLRFSAESARLLAADVSDLPGDLAAFFLSRGVISAAVYPLTMNGQNNGVVIFEECSRERSWSDEQDALMTVIAGLISGSFMCLNYNNNLHGEITKIDLKNKAQTEFITRMSHEIRTPLNVILGMSEALYYKVDNDSNRRLVRSVLSSGKMLLSLLNDTLEISRIDAGRFRLDRKTCDTAEFLDELEITFQDIAAKKNLSFFVEKSLSLPATLVADERRIRQILFNLVMNAISFTRWGHIRVSADYIPAAAGTGNLIFRVSDTGPGIPADKLEHIFDEYTQLEQVMFYDEGSTGLGLSLSRMLAKAMDGDLIAESIEGKGARFILSLPAEEETVPGNDSLKPNDLDDIEFRDASVLIVDDNPMGIEVIESHIGSSRLRIHSASNIETALEKLRNNHIDLIVMDLYMPFISGADMVKMLRTKPEFRNIPMVSYTSVSSDERKLWDPDTFDDHLGKPVTRDNLFRILTKFLRYDLRQKGADNEFNGNSVDLSAG